VSAVEEIQAAIEKLTASKPHLSACPEFQREAVRHIARNCEIECECTNDKCGWDRYETAPALDMLMRTIDAQLKILTGTVELHRSFVMANREADWLAAVERAGDLDLARAINGTPS
jgi:hypothetical protein